MIAHCLVCDKEINKSSYIIKKFGKNVYCGRDCYHRKLKERFPEQHGKCPQCGKSFKIYPSDKTYNRGIYCSKECKDIYQVGENHKRWKGVSSEAERLRKSKKMKQWKKDVLERDNYTCVWCESKRDIEADHIKPRYLFPELALDINNGRTLCLECHRETVSYMNRWLKREDYENLD
jgi:5-methylcytosine-specific restriction endonuclease McrA